MSSKTKIKLALQVQTHKAAVEQAKSKDRTAHARDPKLPYFNDSEGKMYSYLSRLEERNS